jgi:hypothetical protein
VPRKPRYRRRGYDPILKYLRFVKGGRVQVRIPIDPAGRGGHISLGCYANVPAAIQARNDYVRTGRRPPHLLPRWVRYSSGRRGRRCGYWADVRIRRAEASLGPYRTARAAHEAAVRHVVRRLGRERAAAYLDGLADATRLDAV